MKMILKLSLMSDLWLSIKDLNNVKHLKKFKQRINTCCILSNKKVRLVRISRSKKERKHFFLWMKYKVIGIVSTKIYYLLNGVVAKWIRKNIGNTWNY